MTHVHPQKTKIKETLYHMRHTVQKYTTRCLISQQMSSLVIVNFLFILSKHRQAGR
nr:MAG TPA: hypothetical protein [Caudoviricetes sp.]